MSTVTIRLNDDEERLFRDYADFKEMPISTLLKEALQERIEDELDLEAIRDYERRVAANDVEYIDFDKIKDDLGEK